MKPCVHCGAQPHQQFNAQTREIQVWLFHNPGCTALAPKTGER